MSQVIINLPDGVAERLREAAQAEGVTLDQFLASAAAEKLSAWLTVDHLRERATQGRREDLVAYLNESPACPPLPGDE